MATFYGQVFGSAKTSASGGGTYASGLRTFAVRYLELSERNIESRDDNGYGSMLAGYDFGRNEGVGKCQLHEAAKMLRRENLNLDKMLGEQ